MGWFHQARFGMFIHWGLYSLLGRGEWAMFQERIPRKDYARLARRFRPGKFDASAWAALAAEAGMKYMVMTSRHHDGFCLFDSQASDFTSTRSAARRDFLAEYVQAARAAGLKVGLYYSLLDWRFEGYWEPAKYPDSAAAMVEQAHRQVGELLTNYGRIDLLWFDGGWMAHGQTGVADIAAFWRSGELNALARRLQPHILINNRAGLEEDLDTPEQHVAASRPGRGWESCMTMGDSCGWGYVRSNPNLKTVCQLLQHLVTAAAGEGNYLLNCGPRPDGTIRPQEAARLRAIGQWLGHSGEGIYGSQRCGLHGGMIGTWTRKGNVGYLHLFRYPGRQAVVPLVASEAESARLLQTGQELQVRQEYNGRLVLTGLPARPPHPFVNVVKVTFTEEPRSLGEPDHAAWLAGKA
jgi:alpha-L-fucosidase